MTEKPDSGQESIGRPQHVREGRYHKPGAPLEDSVKQHEDPTRLPDEPSAPVTQKDYTGK